MSGSNATWVARVVRELGTTRHLHAGNEAAGSVGPVVRIEIEAADGGYYLFRYGAAGDLLADTWHATVADAHMQAAFEYEHTAWAQGEA